MDYIIKGPGGTTKPIAPKLITVRFWIKKFGNQVNYVSG